MARKYHPDYEDTMFSLGLGEFSVEANENFEKRLKNIDKNIKRSKALGQKENWATLNRVDF